MQGLWRRAMKQSLRGKASALRSTGSGTCDTALLESVGGQRPCVLGSAAAEPEERLLPGVERQVQQERVGLLQGQAFVQSRAAEGLQQQQQGAKSGAGQPHGRDKHRSLVAAGAGTKQQAEDAKDPKAGPKEPCPAAGAQLGLCSDLEVSCCLLACGPRAQRQRLRTYTLGKGGDERRSRQHCAQVDLPREATAEMIRTDRLPASCRRQDQKPLLLVAGPKLGQHFRCGRCS